MTCAAWSATGCGMMGSALRELRRLIERVAGYVFAYLVAYNRGKEDARDEHADQARDDVGDLSDDERRERLRDDWTRDK